MSIKRSIFYTALSVLMAGVIVVSYPTEQADAFSNQVIQQGAVGDDVIELQARLQYLGFYNGKIDGVFGWGTYWALRNFQYEFGMEIDGLAGQSTKQKLVNASQYDEGFVKEQIRQGKDFSYYGGVPKEQQVKDSKKQKQGGQQQGGQQEAEEPSNPAVNIPNG